AGQPASASDAAARAMRMSPRIPEALASRATMPESTNPLIRDRDVDFILYELLDAPALCALDAFADHSRETFDLYLASTRRLAREVLFPAYKPMDEEPAKLVGGRIVIHPRMKALWPQLVALGVISATRPAEVSGQQLP